MKLVFEKRRELLRLPDKRVGPSGISALSLAYDSEDLQDARLRADGDLVVEVFVDPRNVNSVLVRLHDASLLKVETPRPPWTGPVTLREHYAALRSVRAKAACRRDPGAGAA